jgi:hypothetical protein
VRSGHDINARNIIHQLGEHQIWTLTCAWVLVDAEGIPGDGRATKSTERTKRRFARMCEALTPFLA